MLICVLGLSASGKDHVVEIIKNKYSLNKVVQFTTRPIRENEIDGQDYYFIFQKRFENLIEAEAFISYRVFNSHFGKWYYGIKEDCLDLSENNIICIDIEGLLELIDFYGEENIISIFIDVNYETRLNRAKNRPTFNIQEFNRRYKDDLEKIDNIKNKCNYIVENNCLDDCISDIENILSLNL